MVHGRIVIALIGLLAALVAGPARATEPDTWIFAYGDEARTARGAEIEALIEQDFVAYDPDYLVRKVEFGARLHALAARLAALQAGGNEMACSTQIYLEAKWLYHYTALWPRLERQLERLAESLENRDQEFATRQSPEDGSWGACHDEWFHKVEATFVAAHELYDKGLKPKYPIRLADRINSPHMLMDYLENLLISDIARTGIDHRAELGGMTTILSSVFFKEYLQDYLAQVPGLPRNQGIYSAEQFKDAYRPFLRNWQDPETGYWGAWYLSGGRVHKTADLSITYHTIAYLRGRVERWPRIIETTFRIRADPYPYGWMHGGRMNNHNNYDVAKIWRYGWAHMGEADKARARDEIGAMLAWCLNESLGSDGSFQVDPTFFSSLDAEFYFGVSFLDVIGFWDRSKRFWTDARFPDAARLCCLIKKRLAALGMETVQTLSAMARLEQNCGSC